MFEKILSLFERAVAALETLASAGNGTSAASTQDAPAKAPRKTKAPEAPQTPPPANDDGDFLSEPEAKEEPKYERADVKKALQDFGAKNGMDKAQALLLDAGGVKALSDLPIEKFAAVIKAATKK